MPSLESLTNINNRLNSINNRISELEKEKLKLQAKKDPLSAKKIKAKLEKINKELESLNKEKNMTRTAVIDSLAEELGVSKKLPELNKLEKNTTGSEFSSHRLTPQKTPRNKDIKKNETEHTNVYSENKQNDNLQKFHKILDEEQGEQTKKELNEKKSRVWYYILGYLSLGCALICCRKAFLCILFFVIGSILIAIGGDEEEGK